MAAILPHLAILLLLLLLISTLPSSSLAGSNLTPNSSLADGETLVSPGEVFELRFFSPNGSTHRYVGIRYKNFTGADTVVWIANRGSPVTSTGGVLSLSGDGNLLVKDSSGGLVWSSGSKGVTNPSLRLLDTGNLVLTQGAYDDSKSLLWQSFDHPTNVLVSKMKLGSDLTTGLQRYLTSWRSAEDPSPGIYSYRLEPYQIPELYLYNGSEIMCRIGWWNGYALSGLPPATTTTNYVSYMMVDNQYEIYHEFVLVNASVVPQLVLTENGTIQRMVWMNNRWQINLSYPTDGCDAYAICGNFGHCRTADPSSSAAACDCLQGFEQKNPAEWAAENWSGGCKRRAPLTCSTGTTTDQFKMLSGLKLPETANKTAQSNMGFNDCQRSCLRNCSCVAFAMINGVGNTCVTWFGEVLDIRDIVGGGEDLYLRLAASEFAGNQTDNSKKKRQVIIGVTVLSLGILCLVLILLIFWKKKRKQGVLNDNFNDIRGKELELHFFDLSTLRAATNDFSLANKLGQGGFGPVYEGKLVDGQVIAVKRLSKESMQGLNEFKNEVILIAKLQHRNLVRLLGCCIQGDERMLVYEHMQNKSLDSFIFDKTRSSSVDWRKRLDIILGIARGLLYLHQDSRFKIIHRDLKAGNILLDQEMIPKISDFGIARLVKGDQGQESTESTNRVLGTFGYMSPEYAMDGIFSVKSDVFSFGVLVLEILSGRKNRVILEAELNMNLLAHAWKLWKEGKYWELLDETVERSSSTLMSEITRCIQVGLLCVQEGMDDRPTMSTVVMMLGSEAITIPQPKGPGFTIRSKATTAVEGDYSSSTNNCSTNEVTITLLGSR